MNHVNPSGLMRKRGIIFWRKAVWLFLFWLMLSWSIDTQHLWLGAAVALLVASFSENFLLKAEERLHLSGKDIYYVFLFLLILLKEMVTANLKVAYIVLHPRMPITPGVIRIKSQLRTGLGKVIFANAITLTPGTLTVEMDGDTLLIHGLTQRDLCGVTAHPLERILLKMEEG